MNCSPMATTRSVVAETVPMPGRDRIHPAPIQQRLLCRLQACWPDDFIPFASQRYQPLSDRATRLRPADQPA